MRCLCLSSLLLLLLLPLPCGFDCSNEFREQPVACCSAAGWSDHQVHHVAQGPCKDASRSQLGNDVSCCHRPIPATFRS